MRVDLLARDLKIAVVEDDKVFFVYRANKRVERTKSYYMAGVGSITVKLDIGYSSDRKKIRRMMFDIDPRDYFLGQYPSATDDTVNRLTLAVVKVAVTKLPGVKVIHA